MGMIARPINPTSSLFVAQGPYTYSRGRWGNSGETRGGVGKSSQPTHNFNRNYLRNGQSYELQLTGTFTDPSEQNPIKNFGLKRAWVYPGTAQICSVPPIISGTGKATNFKFGRTSTGSIRTKSHKKFCSKGSVGVCRDCPNFLGTPYYFRNR